MSRHSILFKLNILFIIALLATAIAAFLMAFHMVKKDGMELMFKSRLVMKEMRTSQEIPHELMGEFGFKLVEGAKKIEVLNNATRKDNLHRYEPKHIKKHRKLLVYQGHRYVQLKMRNSNILLREKQTFIERFLIPLIVLLGILSLLILMYVLLRRSLTPLKTLESDIVKYGKGELKEYVYVSSKDEVSLASNAFYHTVEKVEKLKASRELFIRNLFHELNTPVTKGKILTEIVDEPKTKEMLDSIFTRLSSLLKELAQMEKLTSDNYIMHKKPIRIQDLVDEASDLLYLDDSVQTNVSDESINADFSSMRIVFKNLIDNALKYGDNIKIVTTNRTISFVSKGKALKKELGFYIEAFSKDRELEREKGFGLGLYIVNEILTRHGMEFSYKYNDGQNIFIIKY